MPSRNWQYHLWLGKAERDEVGVPERWIAAAVQTDQLDIFFHPSIVFIRGGALRGDPSCVGFRVEAVQNIAGLRFRELALVSKMPVLPLVRTNVKNRHPILGGIYGDLFYHHNSGSRPYAMFRAVLLGVFDDPPMAPTELHEQLLAELRDDPDGYLRELTGGVAPAPSPE
jgi:hypothetical protein